MVKTIPFIRCIIETRDRYFALSQQLQSELQGQQNQNEAQQENITFLENSLKACQEQLQENQSKMQYCTDQLTESRAQLKAKSEQVKHIQIFCNELEEHISFLEGKLKDKERSSQHNFNSMKFWEDNYLQGGNSGAGSYRHLAKFKADTLNSFIKDNDIASLVEIGCGDGNQLSLLEISSYTGIDVSETIIRKNRELFCDDRSKVFYHTSERNLYTAKHYELAISLDVIFHLIEDKVYVEYMADLFNIADKFVIIYSSNHEEISPWPEYRHRKFTRYVMENEPNWKLIQYIPNKYQYIIGKEEDTSTSDFYIYKKINID